MISPEDVQPDLTSAGPSFVGVLHDPLRVGEQEEMERRGYVLTYLDRPPQFSSDEVRGSVEMTNWVVWVHRSVYDGAPECLVSGSWQLFLRFPVETRGEKLAGFRTLGQQIAQNYGKNPEWPLRGVDYASVIPSRFYRKWLFDIDRKRTTDELLCVVGWLVPARSFDLLTVRVWIKKETCALLGVTYDVTEGGADAPVQEPEPAPPRRMRFLRARRVWEALRG